MDFSVAFYLLGFILVVWFIKLFANINEKKVIDYTIVGVAIVACILSIFDSALANTWGTRLTSKALSYLPHPDLLLSSAASVNYIFLLILFIIKLALLLFLYKKYFSYEEFKIEKKWAKITIYIVLIPVVLIGRRGGFHTYLISEGRVYYSINQTLNLSALNECWNFMNIFFTDVEKENPYQYFSEKKCNSIFKELSYVPKDTSLQILKSRKPNIVLIFLESFSADNMSQFGGDKNICPFLDSLATKGLFFTNMYATGHRTEQGFVAVLNGFPAQPREGIARVAGKLSLLPSLPRTLKKNGYTISHYFTGSLGYAKTDEYLRLSGYDRIVDEKNFPFNKEAENNWHDQYLFAAHASVPFEKEQPFFTSMLTFNTHDPFEETEVKIFDVDSIEGRYKNSARYSDNSLREYFNAVKNNEWYKNTLFIIIADHAHALPLNRAYNEPARFHIPMILFGEVLKDEFKGYEMKNVCSQVDVGYSILKQMNMLTEKYLMSKDIFNPYTLPYAFYTFDNGFGYIENESYVVYNHDMNEVIMKSTSDNNIAKALENRGKSILEKMYMEYLSLN